MLGSQVRFRWLILAGLAAGLLHLSDRSSLEAQQNSALSSPARNSHFYDPDQRSIRIDNYEEVADSGPGRGETIYFYKCWVCHNQYTAERGPALKDLYQRATLNSGDPVNDQSIAQKIKAGGPRMPSFRTSLSDADLADLLAYIRSGQCCLEGEKPPPNPRYKAELHPWPVPTGLHGGARGHVRVASGDPREGIALQLIAPNGVRTTVYTDVHGYYEFPEMQSGAYTLRIATPREFQPYRRDAVAIQGAVMLPDIVLETLVADTGALPATPEIESQLSSAELLWDLPGTGKEKNAFLRACTSCHSWQQILRNRYDERSWRVLVDRMAGFALTWLGTRKVRDAQGRATNGEVLYPEDLDTVAKWLAKVRGPDSKDEPVHFFPRPSGANTRVVITEYELPRQLLNVHDVWGDPEGNVWYTSHRSTHVGRLDPRTGIVTQYTIPTTPGRVPGSQAVRPGKDGVMLISENWAAKLDTLDPKTGKVTQVDTPGFGNFGTSQDGHVWYAQRGTVFKMDPATGRTVAQFPGHCDSTAYENPISWDGNYWSGGGRPSGNNCVDILDLRTGKWVAASSGKHMMTVKRGGFDPFGNSWWGGGDGAFIELTKTGDLHEFWPSGPPSPYTYFYEVNADKHGEVWGGVLYGRDYLRFDPKLERWRDYQMPEPYSFTRRTWIDNSTDPVTVWYGDYTGFLVRIQPLD